jgi:hypothetical protein
MTELLILFSLSLAAKQPALAAVRQPVPVYQTQAANDAGKEPLPERGSGR